MISLETIEREILELEARDTSYATVERLAWLYTCKDHLSAQVVKEERTANASGSDFLCACDCRPVDKLLLIFDELMAVIGAVYPKEYDLVMKKIEEIEKAN